MWRFWNLQNLFLLGQSEILFIYWLQMVVWFTIRVDEILIRWISIINRQKQKATKLLTVDGDGRKVLFFCKLKEWWHCYGDFRFQWCLTLGSVFLFFMLEIFGCMMHYGLDNASYGAMGFAL